MNGELETHLLEECPLVKLGMLPNLERFREDIAAGKAYQEDIKTFIKDQVVKRLDALNGTLREHESRLTRVEDAAANIKWLVALFGSLMIAVIFDLIRNG